MLLSHDEKEPVIDSDVYVAPNAVVCGDVRIGAGSRILFPCIVAEGKPIRIGENCIVMENAVLRSTDNHDPDDRRSLHRRATRPVVGCTLQDRVFIATGASVFHGAPTLVPESKFESTVLFTCRPNFRQIRSFRLAG
jgi:carbonic anhydrase/acetyltransferase-like protein (isoleucine patch superfamily)